MLIPYYSNVNDKKEFYAEEIAGLIVTTAIKNNVPVINIQINRIIFFLECHFLNLYDKELVADPIQMTGLGMFYKYGFKAYAEFASKPITDSRVNKIIYYDMTIMDTVSVDYSNDLLPTELISELEPLIIKLLEYDVEDLIDISMNYSEWFEHKNKVLHLNNQKLYFDKSRLNNEIINNGLYNELLEVLSHVYALKH